MATYVTLSVHDELVCADVGPFIRESIGKVDPETGAAAGVWKRARGNCLLGSGQFDGSGATDRVIARIKERSASDGDGGDWNSSGTTGKSWG